MWAQVAQAVASGGLQALGSYLSADAAQDASKKAYKRAKEFAQSGIQWKVADAEKAGINPYFALGAPTATYSDSGVGVDPVGEALNAMGQNVSRAALANAPAPDKLAASMQPLLLEKAGLENDYLRAKIASELRLATQAGTPPGLDTIPIADIGMKVAQPGYGQRQEDNYGDFGGGLLGMMALIRDAAVTTGGGPMLDTTKRELNAIMRAYDYLRSSSMASGNIPYGYARRVPGYTGGGSGW